eukprot:TRINITY_DN25584_c0_g1_i1.p2 TRINITY_DN25584_c0_g1~~TRINITY_DN25584_c0_g1_i1.p2  ORF type:complete len:155 (+),score=35.05 TRINITY_DN25584_c0_g1_i1:57-521(+)
MGCCGTHQTTPEETRTDTTYEDVLPTVTVHAPKALELSPRKAAEAQAASEWADGDRATADADDVEEQLRQDAQRAERDRLAGTTGAKAKAKSGSRAPLQGGLGLKKKSDAPPETQYLVDVYTRGLAKIEYRAARQVAADYLDTLFTTASSEVRQ